MIYVNDTGTLVLVDLGTIVLFEEDDIQLNVKKPDTSEVIWDASIYSLNNPTQVFYISDASSFDQGGKYYLQAEVTRDDGRWLGGLASFDVKVRWT